LKHNRTTLIFTIIVSILCGLLLIYRGQQSIDNLYKFNGTVTSMTINEFPSPKSGSRYSLDFGFVETDKVYGIYLGTKDQANYNELKSKIEIGKSYTFYIDQTVPSGRDRQTLGISAIKNNGQSIYQENSKANFIGGFLFLTMGIGLLFILIYADRRKKNGL
jgi:hypothetical protein